MYSFFFIGLWERDVRYDSKCLPPFFTYKSIKSEWIEI
jgi:hypothetical protein